MLASDEDWSERDEEPEERCVHCEARNGEPHQETCPLFLPLCAICGDPAKRFRNGAWRCTKCPRR